MSRDVLVLHPSAQEPDAFALFGGSAERQECERRECVGEGSGVVAGLAYYGDRLRMRARLRRLHGLAGVPEGRALRVASGLAEVVDRPHADPHPPTAVVE